MSTKKSEFKIGDKALWGSGKYKVEIVMIGGAFPDFVNVRFVDSGDKAIVSEDSLKPIVRLVEPEAKYKAGERFRAKLICPSEIDVLWEHDRRGYPQEGEYFIREDGDIVKAGYNHLTPYPIVKRVKERFQVGDKVISEKSKRRGTILEVRGSETFPLRIRRDDGQIYYRGEKEVSLLPESKKAPEKSYPSDLIGRDGTPMWWCDNEDYSDNLQVIYYNTKTRIWSCDDIPSTLIFRFTQKQLPNKRCITAWLKSGGYERMTKDGRVINGVEFEAWYDEVDSLRIRFSEYGKAIKFNTPATLDAAEITCKALGIVPQPYCEKKGDC